jgi:hypothetical protein
LNPADLCGLPPARDQCSGEAASIGNIHAGVFLATVAFREANDDAKNMGAVSMCYWFENDLLGELEASTDEFFGLRQIAKTIGQVARQVAPIVTAIPIVQTQLIGEAAALTGYVLAAVIDLFADEWRAGFDDRAR